MYKNQSHYIKPPLLSTPHYKITVATATATNPPPLLDPLSRHEALLLHPNPNIPSSSMFAPARLMLSIGSWLRTRRSRCIFLLLCSPLLLPLLCATFPLLCIAEVCVRICRRRSSGKAAAAAAAAAEDNVEWLRRCEEGCCCGGGEEREVGLLQRYLEDQLALVGSVYECGDEIEDHDQHESDHDLDNDCKVPLLS